MKEVSKLGLFISKVSFCSGMFLFGAAVFFGMLLNYLTTLYLDSGSMMDKANALYMLAINERMLSVLSFDFAVVIFALVGIIWFGTHFRWEQK
jgi:mannose-1-phosphate guanylyltransferase